MLFFCNDLAYFCKNKEQSEQLWISLNDVFLGDKKDVFVEAATNSRGKAV
jgi:hypothetical protein